MAYGARLPEGQGGRNIKISAVVQLLEFHFFPQKEWYYHFLVSVCDRLLNMAQGRNFGNTTADYIAE